MRVVLRDDVENVGIKGEVVEVRDGFARNYLVPRGLAIKATEGVVQQAEAMRRSREAREAREREAAQAVAAQITRAPIVVAARAGEGGKLFGSVTNADIVEAIAKATGIELDRRRVELPEPLRELGTADVTVRLHADAIAEVVVEVVASE